VKKEKRTLNTNNLLKEKKKGRDIVTEFRSIAKETEKRVGPSLFIGKKECPVAMEKGEKKQGEPQSLRPEQNRRSQKKAAFRLSRKGVTAITGEKKRRTIGPFPRRG